MLVLQRGGRVEALGLCLGGDRRNSDPGETRKVISFFLSASEPNNSGFHTTSTPHPTRPGQQSPQHSDVDGGHKDRQEIIDAPERTCGDPLHPLWSSERSRKSGISHRTRSVHFFKHIPKNLKRRRGACSRATYPLSASENSERDEYNECLRPLSLS